MQYTRYSLFTDLQSGLIIVLPATSGLARCPWLTWPSRLTPLGSRARRSRLPGRPGSAPRRGHPGPAAKLRPEIADLAIKLSQRACVINDEIGDRQPLLPGRLRRHPGLSLLLAQATQPNQPVKLQ